jgi:AcrR family transcriptional regulator
VTVPASSSDVPVREPGTRARSGNAMGRTRSALLAATAECVARYGVRKTTMVDVASKSRVAKATLYNHFRTKDDVLAALVEQQTAELIGACVTAASAQGLVAGLTEAARLIADNAALRKAAQDEPALLAPLMAPGDGRGWQAARDGAAAVLTAAGATSGPAEVELLLRWAVSQLLWPLVPGPARTAAAQAVEAGLGGARPADAPAAVVAPVPAPATAGLGWPH